MSTPNALGIINQHWPYDGPHDPDTTVAAASAISGLVRYLNNATGHHQAALPYAGTADRLGCLLQDAVAGMPQLLSQLQRFLQHQATDPTLYDDRHAPDTYPAAEVACVAAHTLADATSTARLLAEQLDAFTAHASHLGNYDPAAGR